MTNNRTASGRYITLILRHKPETIGIKLDEHGWADVDELLRGVNRAHCLSFEQLEEIVRTDNKQRFSFNEEKTKIRANQGHSISVDVELQEAKTKQRKQTINEAIEKCRLKGAERVAYLSQGDNAGTLLSRCTEHLEIEGRKVNSADLEAICNEVYDKYSDSEEMTFMIKKVISKCKGKKYRSADKDMYEVDAKSTNVRQEILSGNV